MAWINYWSGPKWHKNTIANRIKRKKALSAGPKKNKLFCRPAVHNDMKLPIQNRLIDIYKVTTSRKSRQVLLMKLEMDFNEVFSATLCPGQEVADIRFATRSIVGIHRVNWDTNYSYARHRS